MARKWFVVSLIRGFLVILAAALLPGCSDIPDIERAPDQIEARIFGIFLPLHSAAIRGDVTSVQRLIDEGANVEARDPFGQTPLFWICQKSSNLEIVRLLIRRGADVNGRQWAGCTPLMIASQKGRLAFVKLLLENGADPNAKDMGGLTALRIATERGLKDVKELLLARGAKE